MSNKGVDLLEGVFCDTDMYFLSTNPAISFENYTYMTQTARTVRPG